MTKDKKVKNLIINKLTKEQYKNITTKYSDELYDIVDEAHYTEQEINDIISVKQNKLIAGEGIEILDDGTINNTYTSTNWGDINGNISEQTDLKDVLDYKIDKTIGTQIIPEIPTEPINLEIIGNQKCSNGAIAKGNLISLYKNLLFKCHERGSTIVCNYDEEIENLGNKMCDGAFNGYYTEINPKDSFTFKPFIWEVTSPVQYETSDFCRLHLFSHDLQENYMHVTLLKIEVYIYDTLTNSKKWVTVYNYSGASKDIGQTGFGLYRAGYSLEDYYAIFGIRITISGSPDTTFNLSQVQLVTSRNTDSLADSLQCISNSGGTIWGDLDVYGNITATTQNTDINDNTVATTEFVKNVSVNLDLSNLSETGENKLNTILNNKITNCITEIPQRIKYTLENGTLTIKAGSVVIVPYGVEDLSTTYPVGATFINDNFKVYDTQFEDGKFFVWAELQRDISQNNTTTVSMTRYGGLTISNASGQTVLYNQNNLESGTTNVSSTTYTIYYNSELNRIGYAGDTTTVDTTTRVMPFPIFIGTSNVDTNRLFDKIDEVFNGFGYIGSYVWVDKGVKTLLPNGRNEDGTLKNIEYTPPKILMYDLSKSFHVAQPVTFIIENNNTFGAVTSTDYLSGYTLPSTVSSQYYHLFYNIGENKHYRTSGSTTANWKEIPKCVFGNAYFDGTNITNFNTKLPFRAVDYNELEEVVCIIETYVNGTSGYRIWSDKFCEQWGRSTGGTSYTGTYLKPFKDTNYSFVTGEVIPSSTDTDGFDMATGVSNLTTTGFRFSQTTSRRTHWRACGYIA